MANKADQLYKKQLREYVNGCKLRIQNRNLNIKYLRQDMANTQEQIESAERSNAMEYAQMLRVEKELKNLK